ncbi:MAG: hypothetical protein GY702_21630 [Desulfobulbaceae bacterium]|nr:hypothetical protein [Desulfobulbaceae bacterium]
MKILFYLTFIISSLFPQDLVAAELKSVSRVDVKDIIQLYFTFDTPPGFSSKADNRRIDLIFDDSKKRPALDLFKEDQSIVKILSREIDNKLILSFFFRYQPQSYKLTPSSKNNIVFEVLLGNEYSKSYQNLAERLKGLTVVDRKPVDFTNPYVISPYVKNWLSFFADYESPLEITIPITFTPPLFPIISLLPPGLESNMEVLDEEITKLASQKLWDHVAGKILDNIQLVTDIEQQKLLALTYGEVLALSGDFEGAFKQLYLIQERYHEELIGIYAQYLLVLLRATQEDPYIAEYEFRLLEDKITSQSPLAPYFLLSRIETALASKQNSRLNKLLQLDDIGFPGEIEERVTIRQADYWFTINQPVKAYASYNLLSNSRLLTTQPFSYGGFCNTLYEQKKFKEAAESYKHLASLVADKEQLGLISYREKMSRLHFENKFNLIDDFSQIENAFTGTEAGYLAAIKKNDLMLLRDKNWAENAIKNYQIIAKEATKRALREEAIFKEILVHKLLGESKTAIEMSQQLLREFRTGNVRISTQALLIDLLPDEIKKLVDKKQYMKALVLAKQNRDLFQNNWVDSKFLIDIADAYHRIGIYDEAQKLYLYLIEIMSVEKREFFFVPMIQATFDHGNYTLVRDYAAQYDYNYPDGKYSEDVLLLRLQALIANEQISDALALLESPLPEKVVFNRLAAHLYFRVDDFENSLNALRTLQLTDTLSPKEQFIFAECLYQANIDDQAQEAYLAITKDNSFYDQSIYRLAELAKRNGNEKKALTLFKQIVETGKNPRWIKIAERELQFNNLKDRF